ncbi:MAG TPA: DNA gyrase inhibitor YacG [Burkholderiaceae bacterium]|nr:DNA gyrase inhibitor YacG [Burkholderiaceae bacterium]
MSRPEQTRQVPCPTCGRPSAFAPANRWRPFCSERCRSIDLGAWASERFRVARDGSTAGGDEGAIAMPDQRQLGEGA